MFFLTSRRIKIATRCPFHRNNSTTRESELGESPKAVDLETDAVRVRQSNLACGEKAGPSSFSSSSTLGSLHLTHIKQRGHPDSHHKSTKIPCKTKIYNRMLLFETSILGSNIASFSKNNSERALCRRLSIHKIDLNVSPPDQDMTPQTMDHVIHCISVRL